MVKDGNTGVVIPFMIVDENGIVLANVPPGNPAEIEEVNLSDENLQEGTTLTVNGKNQGILIFTRMPEYFGPAENRFFSLVDAASFCAALAGITISIVISLLFTRQFTLPIRDLSEAALQIAEGKLGQQVQINRNDEVGVLAKSFNLMSVELEKADSQRRQMTADIAHELRNPMTVQGIHLEGLKDGTLKMTPERVDILFNIHNQMWHIIDDLRDLSLADANKLPLHKVEVQLMDVVQNVVNAYREMAEEKGIELACIWEDDLPRIMVDRSRIAQVIGNLVHNALDNTGRGGRVTLEADFTDDDVVIGVTDTGVGIPEDEIPLIFQRFYRIDPSRQSERGNSGLGLAIANSLTEAHGGHIQVKSREGFGSTFSVFLPLV